MTSTRICGGSSPGGSGSRTCRSVQARVTSDEAASVLIERSERNFLYVALALQGIEQDQDSFDRLVELPRGLDAMVSRSLERLFPVTPGVRWCAARIQIILAAQEPPAAELLGAATGMDVEYELSDLLEVATCLRPAGPGRPPLRLRQFVAGGVARGQGEGERFHVSRCRGHDRLADAGLADWRRNPAKMSAYHLKFLPTHLSERLPLGRTGAVLLDPAYLESRASLPGLAGQEAWVELSNAFSTLAANIDDPRQRRMVRLYDDTLRSHTWFLGKHPLAVPGVLERPLVARRAGHRAALRAGQHAPQRASGFCTGGDPVSSRMEQWRKWKGEPEPGHVWLRSPRPPHDPPSADRVLLSGHDAWVVAGHVISQPPRVLTATSEGTLHLWEAERGTRLRRQECGGGITQVFLLPGGEGSSLCSVTAGSCCGISAPGERSASSARRARRSRPWKFHGRLVAAAIKCRDEPDEPSGLVRCWDVTTGRVCAELDTSLPAYLLTFAPARGHAGRGVARGKRGGTAADPQRPGP